MAQLSHQIKKREEVKIIPPQMAKKVGCTFTDDNSVQIQLQYAEIKKGMVDKTNKI